MTYAPPKRVEAQPRVALPFGLFSVVTFRESSDGHVFGGGVEWQAMNCGPVSAVEDPGCTTFGTAEGLFEKDFSSGSLVPGSATPFLAYATDLCGASARQMQEGEENATAKLLAREEAQAEAAVWRRLAAEATDVNPGGAVPVNVGLAVLERWIGREYGSLGVVHGDRGTVSLLDTNVSGSGPRLVTKLGTPVVAGSGYPGTGPGADEEQRVTLVDESDEVTAPSGTFTLSVGGETTAPIAWDATGAAVASALNALNGVNGAVGTGSLPGDVALTFPGYEGENVPNLVMDDSGLALASATATTIEEGGPAALADGEAWLMASPAMFGYRGPVMTNSALDHATNDHYALAERQYVVGFDPCGVAAVRVTTDFPTPVG